MEYKIVKADELYHYGVLGMKWGIRRYQNKNGSLTPAGEKRRNKQTTAKSAAEHYKKQRDEADKYFYQELDKHGKLGEKKWREAVDKGYKGKLDEWFETEMWKDQEMVDLQARIDSIAYKRRNLDRKYEASLAYAETLDFKNSDRTVDKVASDGIWKEGKDAVNEYLDKKNRNIPTFKRDPNNPPDYSDYDDLDHSAIDPDDFSEDELYHHGIKGMRWGVRRYQNKDGSLTPAGAKRRAKLESKLEKLGGKKKAAETSSTEQPAKKTASNMSDDELAKAITRARMEDEYRRLRPEPKPVEKHAFMKQMFNDVVKPAMINSGKKALESAMGQVVEKLTKGKVDPNSIEALKKTYEKLDYKQKIDKIVNPDKYLSEEDRNKRQQRTFDAEDRAAKMEGYQNAADKAAQERTRAEADRKAAADEAAGRANVPRSEEYYNSRYNTKGGEKTDVGSNTNYGLTVYNQSASSLANAKSVIKEFSTSSVTDLSTTSINKGRENVNDYSGQVLLDKDGRIIRRLDD